VHNEYPAPFPSPARGMTDADEHHEHDEHDGMEVTRMASALAEANGASGSSGFVDDRLDAMARCYPVEVPDPT
jgi:hypothetical protein